MSYKIVSHHLIKHAAHYMYDPGTGHDLEQWVTESSDTQMRPTFDERAAIGIPVDAEYSTGHVVEGRQRWTWEARRPFSPGWCERCYPVVKTSEARVGR